MRALGRLLAVGLFLALAGCGVRNAPHPPRPNPVQPVEPPDAGCRSCTER
jgi:hypothetical protein